jgi:hypothetical protein
MKTIFAGPSIYGLELSFDGIDLRPPAQRDDVAKAVESGANVIGLVDGHYEHVPSVWHKEILYALSLGVQVLGAASMGALRAAECQAFGMVPVGEIARRYCGGEFYDDDAVAILNGPAELGYVPLTEPLVDVEATLPHLVAVGAATAAEAESLRGAACQLFFKERTDAAIVDLGAPAGRREALLEAYRTHRICLKSRDAAALVDAVKVLPDQRVTRPDWTLAASPFWRQRGQPELALVS